MTQFALDLPDSLLDGAKAAAARDGTTVEQLLTLAIAEKLSALDAEELIAKRAARADAQAYRAILDRVPDVPPAAGDELPNP
jgi:hypothetical protein